MGNKAARELWKQALWWTKIKLVYTRITLTRFTTLYFLFALLNCIVLVICQGVTFGDNVQAVNVVATLFQDNATISKRLPIFSGGVLKMCDGVPGQPVSDCTVVATSHHRRDVSALRGVNEVAKSVNLFQMVDDLAGHDEDRETMDDDDEEEDFDEYSESMDDTGDEDSDEHRKVIDNKEEPHHDKLKIDNESPKGVATNGNSGPPVNSTRLVDPQCADVMLWLHVVLSDAKREDLVTLFFQIWLFSLSVVAILNESLPHLIAAFASHILGTAWAGYRIQSTEKLRRNYMGLISAGVCNGVDRLGNWWEIRRLHAIPILVISVLTLVAAGYLSANLYKVYTSQTFSRVGASPQINRIYKLVLFLSVSLQLTAFFSLASTAIWIDKISHGNIRLMAAHIRIYLAAFAVTLVFELPWLVLGWISVRREYRKRFWVFCALSFFLLAISTLMFASPLYRFIFNTWAFFATITVTSYILMVSTSLLGIWCRLHFGKGLAHFLQVSEALEDADFTPVCFSNDNEKATEFPVHFDGGYESLKSYPKQLDPVYRSTAKRGESVYSEPNGVPVILSSTPPLFQDQSLTNVAGFDMVRSARAIKGNTLSSVKTTETDSYTESPIRSKHIANLPHPSMRQKPRGRIPSSRRSSYQSVASRGPSKRDQPTNTHPSPPTSSYF